MKKIIIAAAVLLLVCASAFAVYEQQRVVDYGGINVGVSYIYDTYKFGEDTTVVDKAGQVGVGFTDFTFFGDTNLGLYIEADILVTVSDNNDENNENKAPVYADIGLGLAFKRDITKNSLLLGGIGIDMMYFSRENTYYTMSGHFVVERTYVTMGVAADLEIAYKLGRDVYFSLGVKGDINFAKWVTVDATDYTYWGPHTSSETQDTEGYFGYKITPKVSFYLVF
ncbi:MAG: hypothetical protein ILP16_01025 [Spirochaetales bacterium]|nr:hypothetical protein [Spirochaetales bacterium]